MKDKTQSKPSLITKGKTAFDGLKKREQNLLFIAIPVTIVLVFFLLLIEPEFNRARSLDKSVSQLQNQLKISRQSNAELLKQAEIDPNATIRQQIESLEKRLAQLNTQFEGELSQLVPPKAMAVLLEQLFNKASSLSLISMKSVAPKVLLVSGIENSSQAQNNQASSNSQQPIYRHGIEIIFEGNFFATRNFLSQAEKLGWKLYWQDLTYAVEEHPIAVTKMTLFTLSTSEAFIGVN
jgi:MSHA biogenesis protein MshJ